MTSPGRSHRRAGRSRRLDLGALRALLRPAGARAAFRRASLPPELPGLDPAWSRLVDGVDSTGTARRWHVLDTGPVDGQRGTLLAVHGNPTWSYLWRGLLAAPPAGWRVVAIDQLGMGYSDRPVGTRRLAQRIDDVGSVVDALGLTGVVVPVAHDWGGAISLGWAARVAASPASGIDIAGVVLTNTALHQPEGTAVPPLIRLAGTRGLREFACRVTPIFVRGATAVSALSRTLAPPQVRDAFAAPYRGTERREAVADFVADIPLDASHPSAAALAGVTEAIAATLADRPALLLWGTKDPVFIDRYLRDAIGRFPHADVHRFAAASHLVTEDAPQALTAIARWVEQLDVAMPAPIGGPDVAPPWAGLSARAEDDADAVVEMGPSGPSRSITFAGLDRRVRRCAAGLRIRGVGPGQRVALLIEPGIDLATVVYACWQIGAVIVVADAGLGLRPLGQALRGAEPDWVIGIGRGLLAARALRVGGRMILVGPHQAASEVATRIGGVEADLETVIADGRLAAHDTGYRPDPDADCAVVFTSGSTGPCKGVVYTGRRLAAQLDVLRRTFDLTSSDRLVAAFAPFALYGPALGVTCVVPDCDVTAPATLTAAALAEAVGAVEASVVFAAPAALRNVSATAGDLTPTQRAALTRPRLLVSAGAPVPVRLQRQVSRLLPHAEVHSPYGMTEALPVTDVSLSEIEKALAEQPSDGVCVGAPVPGVDVRISPLDADGRAERAPQELVGVVGEVCVRAAHVKARYDRLWFTEWRSSRDEGWHRTGDVGHLDSAGRLWIEGRLTDVLTTAGSALTPVPVEQSVEALAGVSSAALVGVGPAGTQQPVVVVVPSFVSRSAGLAATALAAVESVRRRVSSPRRPLSRRELSLSSPELTGAVRAAAGVTVAAVLEAARLPVDVRHNSKIDHPSLARSAARLLTGWGPPAGEDGNTLP